MSIHHPSSTSARTRWPWSTSHWMASVISSSPRSDGRMAATASWTRASNRYTPTRARLLGGSAGFSSRRTTEPSESQLGHAEPVRVGHRLEQDLGTRSRSAVVVQGGRLGPGPLVLEAVDEVLQALFEQIVTQIHHEVVLAQEVPGDQDGVGQSERRFLREVGDLQPPPRAVADRSHDLVGGVAHDDADLLDAGVGDGFHP